MHCQGKRWKWNKPPGTVLVQFVPLQLLSQPKHTVHTDVLDISVPRVCTGAAVSTVGA